MGNALRYYLIELNVRVQTASEYGGVAGPCEHNNGSSG
jgi:hypothetical protein